MRLAWCLKQKPFCTTEGFLVGGKENVSTVLTMRNVTNVFCENRNEKKVHSFL